MSIKRRIQHLETKARAWQAAYAHLTDEELRAQVIRMAADLRASGPLDAQTEAFLKANGLGFGASRLPSDTQIT